jgi:DNA (cytosine-5)-methyltransferase 1
VVIRDLRRLGYTVAKPTIIAAAALGAGHIRRRVWIYAHADSKRRVQPQGGVKDQRDRAGDSAAIPRNTSGLGQQEMREPDKECIEARGYTTPWWASEPDVARVVHGIPHRVDGAKALGNAQVPIVAATAFDLLSGG